MNHVSVLYPEISTSAIPVYKAYKGFNKDLKCKDYQFIIGETHSVDNPVANPQLCSKQGFHYCDTLQQVLNHYANCSGNRFCEVEIIGSHTKDSTKGIATSIRIVREISQDEISKILAEEKMNLPLIRHLQKKYPLLQIGGSIALFLYGANLSRLKDGTGDIDLCMPYYFQITNDELVCIDEDEEKENEKFYANDFSETLYINGIKCDLCISPSQRYEIISYNGFEYRLASFDVIMEAKCRYALKGNKKHKEDIRELVLNKKPAPSKPPF